MQQCPGSAPGLGLAAPVRVRAEAVAPFGIAVAASLAAGVLAALWPLSLALLLSGGAMYVGVPRAFAVGCGCLGLVAGMVLARQLPADWEKRVTTLSGQVVELPQAEVQLRRFMLRVDADATQPAPLRGRLLQLAWYDVSVRTCPGRARHAAGRRALASERAPARAARAQQSWRLRRRRSICAGARDQRQRLRDRAARGRRTGAGARHRCLARAASCAPPV